MASPRQQEPVSEEEQHYRRGPTEVRRWLQRDWNCPPVFESLSSLFLETREDRSRLMWLKGWDSENQEQVSLLVKVLDSVPSRELPETQRLELRFAEAPPDSGYWDPRQQLWLSTPATSSAGPPVVQTQWAKPPPAALQRNMTPQGLTPPPPLAAPQQKQPVAPLKAPPPKAAQPGSSHQHPDTTSTTRIVGGDSPPRPPPIVSGTSSTPTTAHQPADGTSEQRDRKKEVGFHPVEQVELYAMEEAQPAVDDLRAVLPKDPRVSSSSDLVDLQRFWGDGAPRW